MIREAPALSLCAAFRQRTRVLHTKAERSGVVREVLSGKASRQGYALFLRNLLPAYEEMESRLRERCAIPGFQGVARPEIYRAPSIKADLACLFGSAWFRSLPILPAGEDYARRVAIAGQGDGFGLLAHVYVRYLGDLNGGRVLKRILAQSPGLGPETLSFYEFPDIPDLDSFKVSYRAAIDESALRIADMKSVIEESAVAFELNILVSEAVQHAVAEDSPALSSATATPLAADPV